MMEFVPNGDLKLSPSQILKMRWMLTLVQRWWHQFDVQRSFSHPSSLYGFVGAITFQRKQEEGGYA